MIELTSAEPETLGLDPKGLVHADALIARYIDKQLLPGGLLLIAREGAIAHLSTQGMADRERGTPVAEDTLYRIYSMTKPITSVALLMLLEAGQLQLDDPVAKYISAFAKTGVFMLGTTDGFLTKPVGRPMTLRDLLTHQSGLTYGFQSRTNVDAAYRSLNIDEFPGTLAEWVEILATLPLEFSPGTAWNYSVSTDVLGRIVEIVSGQTLEDFFRTRIFEPLGMSDTGFFVTKEDHDRLAACYQRGRNGSLALHDVPATRKFLTRPQFLSGGGGLVSTAKDYLRFAEMLNAGGTVDDVRLLGRKTVELMMMNHLPGGVDLAGHAVSSGIFSEAAQTGSGFGLGGSTLIDLAKAQITGSVGDFAWGGAASTYFWVDPAEDLIVIFMTQLLPSSATNIRRELRSVIYGALM